MDISAGALMEDGTPVLIADVEDMIVSMQKLSSQRLVKVGAKAASTDDTRRKRVLIVDDSLTVRELERKLLGHHGYQIQVAVDGMDGWNAARAGDFDLVITDVDMPRMDGIELVTQIRHHPNLKNLPVMIVSYKDREEDRERGLEAGADYYLAKASFNDDALIRAVIDLIGEAQA
jgi:two-component system sensor histidine kinase and response regulator WspE